jgi:alpha-amylase/alpha-mannosidase (GH57 family)
MIDLVFGLHLYQPPNQKPEVLERITKESYLPVIDLILSHPSARFTVDIAGSAIEILEKQNQGAYFLEKLKMAAISNKIHLVNTACYHPILPLLPQKETVRQAALNEECYKNLLQKSYRKSEGFFPPEMAFSPKFASVLGKLGYTWTVASDIPFACHHKCDPPFDWIPGQKNLAVFLRSNLWSNKIAFDNLSGKTFARNLKQDLKKWFGEKRGYLIIWLDWETFGHHRPNFVNRFLLSFLDNLGGINLCFPSRLLSHYPTKEFFLPSGSWSTSADDFHHKNYWPLWKSPGNEFHRLWWELAEIILKIKGNAKKEATVFDKALYSCQPWQWSYGNKTLAKRGLGYFKEILNLEVSANYRGKMHEIIEKLENLCKQK